MNTPVFRSALLQASAIALLLSAAAAQAMPVPLVGGQAHPLESGFTTVPPPVVPPYSADEVASVVDADSATGLRFTSHAGEFVDTPLATLGFELRFDFDVSGYETIEGIDFTWMGRYELDSDSYDSFANVYLTAGDFRLANGFATGNDLGTDNLHTFTASFDQLGDGVDDIDLVLHDGLASLYVATGLGLTFNGPPLPFHALDTREVVADVRGTLRDTVSVPEPGTLSLFAAAVVGSLLMRRRRIRKT